MASHHRWSYTVQCGGCRTSCIVSVTEQAGPPFTDAESPRDYVIGAGFRARRAAPFQIECCGCGGPAAKA